MSQLDARPIAAVIFDHDGTLVDSEPIHLDCWRQVLLRLGSNLSAEDYANNLSGIPSIESARWLVRNLDLPLHPEQLYTEKRRVLQNYLAHTAFPLMRGVREVLKELATKDVVMAIASGAMRAEVQRSVDYHGLSSHMRAVVTSDDAANNKPAPDIYLEAARRLAKKPELCVAIEDSDSGERAALAAGMRCLRLNTPTRLPLHADRLVVDDLEMAQQWLLPRLTAKL